MPAPTIAELALSSATDNWRENIDLKKRVKELEETVARHETMLKSLSILVKRDIPHPPEDLRKP